VAAVVLAANVVFHAALAWTQAPSQSLYRHRSVVAAAIRLKQPEMLGHRRPFAIDAGPLALDDSSRPYSSRDVVIEGSEMTIGVGRSAQWTLVLRNANRQVAFRDFVYAAEYRDARGRPVQRRQDVIKDLLQPGEVRRFDVADMVVNPEVRTGTFELVAAEALLPAP
jgi:hypothetical protein